MIPLSPGHTLQHTECAPSTASSQASQPPLMHHCHQASCRGVLLEHKHPSTSSYSTWMSCRSFMMLRAWGCSISTWMRGSAATCMGQQRHQAVSCRQWKSPIRNSSPPLQGASVPEKQSKKIKKKGAHVTQKGKSQVSQLSSLWELQIFAELYPIFLHICPTSKDG